MMALMKEQSDQLKDYFPVRAHEFLEGKTYISEEAVTNRLDEVDPSWEFVRLEIYPRDDQMIATYRLTVCGVSRDGVGMSKINPKAGEPEKAAATDALKRAARLFGIGRYILEMKGVNDYRTLEEWLIKRRGVDTSTGEIELVGKTGTQSSATVPNSSAVPEVAVTPSRTPQQALAGNGHKPGEKKRMGDSQWATFRNDLLYNLGQVAPQFAFEERGNTVAKMHEEGAFDGIDVNEAVKMVMARLAKHRKEKTS